MIFVESLSAKEAYRIDEMTEDQIKERLEVEGVLSGIFLLGYDQGNREAEREPLEEAVGEDQVGGGEEPTE